MVGCANFFKRVGAEDLPPTPTTPHTTTTLATPVSRLITQHNDKQHSTMTDTLPPPQGERHTLAAEEELRLEVPFQKQLTCTLTLQKGSCELFGLELPLQQPIVCVDGGLHLPLFTWHGCVVDVDCEQNDMIYTSDETEANVSWVNTHAQLEALRETPVGPRVLVVGPPASGKTSLVKVLTAYATKVGRTPVLVDLDVADNSLSVPGTLVACPMHREALDLQAWATTGVPAGTTSPLALWHGDTNIQPDLFRAQVTSLGQKIQQRLKTDEWALSSGILVNTSTEDVDLIQHIVQALDISVLLVLAHDRLYSTLKKKVPNIPKLIKLPRSGGVVTPDAAHVRHGRTRSLHKYFYGDMVLPTNGDHRVPQLTPFLLQLSFSELTLYEYSSMTLSKSLLPVAGAQMTQAVQLKRVNELTEALQSNVWAVCHPNAVAQYEASGNAQDLYTAGVAGFVVVERVLMDQERVHLLSPCAGTLSSMTLLAGKVTWME